MELSFSPKLSLATLSLSLSDIWHQRRLSLKQGSLPLSAETKTLFSFMTCHARPCPAISVIHIRMSLSAQPTWISSTQNRGGGVI